MNVILGLRILLAMSALLAGEDAALLGLLPDWPPSASAAASAPATMPAATPAPQPGQPARAEAARACCAWPAPG
ncbi:hypothetical protein ACFFMP_02755 [Pseudoroseomonas cervicalis]|uniref:hypothetical protein n=1 Tax=Teichococcus cervicalis TaxID=204525 RepID=UPI0035EC62D7